jgi:transcription initiation factor TFIIF subunit alpha
VTPKSAGKRKAEDVSGGSGAAGTPKLKKRKPITGAPPTPGSASASSSIPTSSAGTSNFPTPPITPQTHLTESLLIQWLSNTPNATTRDCIHYFQACLTDDGKKARFTKMVKDVAALKGGVLYLKPRGAGAGAGAAGGSGGGVQVKREGA